MTIHSSHLRIALTSRRGRIVVLLCLRRLLRQRGAAKYHESRGQTYDTKLRPYQHLIAPIGQENKLPEKLVRGVMA
jgi:hypothetical protein